MPMSKLRILFLTFGIVAVAGQIVMGQQDQSQMRPWRDITGRHSITAEFVDLANGIVRLKTADGRMLPVPLVQLSLPDRQYVMQHTAAHAPTQSAPSPKPGSGPEPAYRTDKEDQPEKGACTFQITGLMHRRLQKSFPIAGRPFRYDVYTLCDECWSQLRKHSDFLPLRRQISATLSSAGQNARQAPLIFTTYYSFPLDTDLGPIAKAVVEARLAHDSERAFFVLFEANLNDRSLQAATGALRALPGVEADGTSYDARSKVLRVQISGTASVSVPDVMASLQGAGVAVRRVTRPPWGSPARGQGGLQGRVPQRIGGGRP
jgi:hypothetical protein